MFSLTEHDLSQGDEVLLLVVRHGRHRIGLKHFLVIIKNVLIIIHVIASHSNLRGVKGDDIEDPTAVEEQAGLVDHQDLGGVEGAAGQTGGVDVPEKGCERK